MKASIKKIGKCYILYDEDSTSKVIPDWFSPDYWQSQQAITGQALGRGAAWFIKKGSIEWVLRHYRRGGLVARVMADQYLWTGLERTRAWREWRLLLDMYQSGLPVPPPVAARVERHGLFYRADLLTVKIPNTQSLAQRLSTAYLDFSVWRKIGLIIARFHQAGICHADLNANNILLDDQDRVFIIDFDRGTQRERGAWEKANIDRLLRSLLKLHRLSGEKLYFKQSDWQVLSRTWQKSC